MENDKDLQNQVKTHKKNPFMLNAEKVKIKVVQCYSTSNFITPDDIRIEDGMALPKHGDSFKDNEVTKSFLVDRQKSCKVYQTEDADALIRKLDGNGRTMLLYIQQNIGPNTDVIYLHPAKYSDFSGAISVKTFYNAINQLMNTVLAKHSLYRYWINPFYIFRGDRTEMYPENVEVVAKVRIKK